MKNVVLPILSLLFGALLFGCVNTSKSNKPRQPLTVIQDAPEFELKNVLGGQIHSKDFKGKVVVVDFWATWCPPCKVEMPQYNKMRAKMKDQGLEFIGVTFESGSPDDIKPYLKDLGVEYPVGMATDEIDAQLGGHVGLPTTFLIGKDWKVYRKIAGSNAAKLVNLEKDIQDLLAKTAD